MATVNDFKMYFDNLVEEGKGERIVKKLYDGMITEIDDIEALVTEIDVDSKGIVYGQVLKGEFLLG